MKIELDKECATLEDNAIIVGHSLGGAELIKYLSEEKLARPLAELFLAATPYKGKDGE